VAEIEAMSLDVALDLGIFREDAAKIASGAVYGTDQNGSSFRFH
jgi:hypothetical protein